LVLDISKERSASVFKVQGDEEDDIPEEVNRHKHRCGNLSIFKQTELREATGQLKLQQAYQRYCSTSI
jgi:hypothetical protein